MLEVFSASRIAYLSIFFLLYNFAVVDSQQDEVDNHIKLGNALLAKGQFSDALQHYHAAVDLDPNNYQVLYRRATVFLATGKVRAALPDLDRVIKLKPDFIAGRIQRGNILFKQGRFDDSATDFNFAIQHDKNHKEAIGNLEKLKLLIEWIEQAEDFFDNNDFQNAEILLNKAIEHSEWNPDLHRKRSKCRIARGDVQNAIADIRTIAKLVPDSMEAYLEMSQMYYNVGDIENSLMQIRECLKLDPDHKECFPFYKRVKKLAKMRELLEKTSNEEKWTECLEKGRQILKFEKKIENVQLNVFRFTCKCNYKLNHIDEAIQECTEVLNQLDENDLDILLDRGEAYLLKEQYEQALEDFQKAVNAHESSRRAKEALNRAQKLHTLSKKVDYYKVLGVTRSSNKKEIMKAYRKLAQKWHPDNFKDLKEKEKAQEKFINIANAKDVLTDQEKRKMYDSGVDPNDPQSGAHEGGWHGDSPFGHGFPFGSGGGGGGGYSFKFHFG